MGRGWWWWWFWPGQGPLSWTRSSCIIYEERKTTTMMRTSTVRTKVPGRALRGLGGACRLPNPACMSLGRLQCRHCVTVGLALHARTYICIRLAWCGHVSLWCRRQRNVTLCGCCGSIGAGVLLHARRAHCCKFVVGLHTICCCSKAMAQGCTLRIHTYDAAGQTPMTVLPPTAYIIHILAAVVASGGGGFML